MRERRIKRLGRLSPLYRVENEFSPESQQQYFQISVNVLEARQLAWSNSHTANSFVMVIIGRKTQRTTTRKNMEEPIYREYILFEMYMSIQEIQRTNVYLAVLEPRCCSPPKLLGEATIELGAVWSQPNHNMYHQWAQLNPPRYLRESGVVGFLKVDISISLRGEVQVMPALMTTEETEEHFVMPPELEPQEANYMISIHAGVSLPSISHAGTERRCGKPPNTYVRVTFCGLVGKTKVIRHNDPIYSEQISMVEVFPNMNQTILFEVCSTEGYYDRVLASTELGMNQISYDGENGFLPTFGPSLLHMYGPLSGSAGASYNDDAPYHKGALLVSFKTVVPFYEASLRSISVNPIPCIELKKLWVQEEFAIYCPIFEISMIDSELTGAKNGVAITMGEILCEKKADEEFYATLAELKQHKLYYTGTLDVIQTKNMALNEFSEEYPVLQLAIRLPDFRFRMYRNNIVRSIVSELEEALTHIEKRLLQLNFVSPSELTDQISKVVDDAAGNILKFLDIMQYSCDLGGEEPTHQYYTELDQKLSALQKEQIEKIYHEITRKAGVDDISSVFQQSCKIGKKESLFGTKKGAKYMLAEAKILAKNLRSTIFQTPHGWPDITVWLLNDRGSRVAYKKLSAAEILYSVIPEQCGKLCGHIQTIYMKPVKCTKHASTSTANCFCIASKVELMLWMGLFRQRYVFQNFLPAGYNVTALTHEIHIKTCPLMLGFKAFIYRGKITKANHLNCDDCFNSFVRVNAFGIAMDTKIQPKTAAPVWNQVLKNQKLINTTYERLVNYPPFFLVEVYDETIMNQTQLIGRFQIQPMIEEVNCAPKLQWYDIFKGAQCNGQIMMSVLLLMGDKTTVERIQEPETTSAYQSLIEETVQGVTDLEESLPSFLIPKSSSFKIDVYWWGLRDINVIRKPCVELEIDDVVLRSEAITDRKSNSNFRKTHTSEVFKSTLAEDYTPVVNIKLYDSSTFGRTVFLGTNTVKNPSKYVMEWIPEQEREACLKSVSVISSAFREVNGQMLCVKRSTNKDDEIFNDKHTPLQRTAKKSRWAYFLCQQQKKDESMALLPLYEANRDDYSEENMAMAHFEGKKNDWWKRFSQSIEVSDCDEKRSFSDYITIYDYELELQPQFFKFKDWCSTIKFYNGKKSGIPEKDELLRCGSVKAGIAIYRWPPPHNVTPVSVYGVKLENGYFEDHPRNDPCKCLVRVYVVKAILDKDINRNLRPYVIMSCGKKRLGEKKEYKSYKSEAVFGKMYEFSCSLPEDYLLNVSVYDYDPLQPEQLIGNTTIDLEDRVYSKHRACVGLPNIYNVRGPAKWRDCLKPSTILEDICAKNHIPPPVFPNSNTVVLNGVEYTESETDFYNGTSEESKENICLSILNRWHTLPVCGYQLVPEHVETRSLFHPDVPGVEQGKIMMWVDIFPFHSMSFIPSPYDITPKKIKEYQLRVIVWDVKSFKKKQEKNSWEMSDLYVKVWLGCKDQAQETDVHFHSDSGVGKFNWRMVFNFSYHPMEKKLINREKCPFTEFEEHIPPVLEVQLLDYNEEKVLGSLTLNLNSMYHGSTKVPKTMFEGKESTANINLFTTKSVRAWWPLGFLDLSRGKETVTGYIHMELTLLPLEKAVHMPVGIGRDSPNPLPLPSRPGPSKRKTDFMNIKEMVNARSKDLLMLFVTVTVVWFVAYVAYVWMVPPADPFNTILIPECYSPQKQAQGIIRNLYP